MENFEYKKSLGQNFIFDNNLLKAIARDGDVLPSDTVLEIGAGAGTLTSILADMAKKVISFEIDKSLYDHLNKLADSKGNIEFHFMDFMQADLTKLFDGKAKVVANIPYYITTPIIFKLVKSIDMFDCILVLIQKEVAERFVAKPESKDYGITSVLLQSIFDVSITRVVKKECFTPSPKVDSAVCKLVPNNKYDVTDFDNFAKFVQLSFSMRRKTLVNNLKSHYDKEKIINVLMDDGFNINIRPEEISVKDFAKIYRFVAN